MYYKENVPPSFTVVTPLPKIPNYAVEKGSKVKCMTSEEEPVSDSKWLPLTPV